MTFSAQIIASVIDDLICHIVKSQPQYSGVSNGKFFDSSGKVNADSLLTMQMLSYVAQLFGLSEAQVQPLLESRQREEWGASISDTLSKADDPILTFMTSGTTGRPKTLQHPLSRLLEEAKFWASKYQDIDVMYRWVPSHHIYGFIWTVLLPHKLDVPVVDCRSKLIQHALSQTQRGLLVAIPDQIHGVIANEQQCLQCDLALSTAPVSSEHWKTLAMQRWHSNTVIYGSTETGAVAYKTAENHPFQLLPYLYKEHSKVMRAEKALDLQDELHWVNDREFHLVGRIDNVVQHRGYNLDLQHIKHVLLTHSKLVDADVYVSNEQGVSALIFSLSCMRDDGEDIEQWIQSHCASTMQPSRIEWHFTEAS